MNSLVRRRSGFSMRMLHVFRDERAQTENYLQSERAAPPNISNKDHRIFGLRQKTGTPSFGKESDAANFHRHISFYRETVDRIDGVKHPKPNMRHVKRRMVENRRRKIPGQSIGFHRKNSPGHMDATVDNRPDPQPRQVSLLSSQT